MTVQAALDDREPDAAASSASSSARRSGPGSLEALQRAPRYLRETSLFPYEDGFAFANRAPRRGRLRRASTPPYADPPESTEQVLHPDKYLQREPPVEVGIPLASPPARRRLVATRAGHARRAASSASGCARASSPRARPARRPPAGAGTGLVLLRGPNDAIAVGLVTAWDTPADALEFAAARRRHRPRWRGVDRRRTWSSCERADAVADRSRSRSAPSAATTCRGARRLTPTRYIASGAEIPSSASAFASEIRVASTSARRVADRSGASASTTRASR